MARLLSQTLIRTSSSSSSSYQTLIHSKSDLSNAPRILTQRHRSNQSGKAQLIQVDLESDSDSEVLGIRKLEDVIHSIIVKRSAPDWLPFVPGASYWVPPPRRPQGLVEVLGTLHHPFMGNDRMSSSSSSSNNSVRGWPSSAFYIEGTSSTHPVPVEMEVVEVSVHTTLESASQTDEDEES